MMHKNSNKSSGIEREGKGEKKSNLILVLLMNKIERAQYQTTNATT
jgi:hypothetical protein